MPNESALSIVIKLQDEATAGLEALATKVGTIGDTMVSKMASVGKSFTSMGEGLISFGENVQYAGMRMSIGLTAPIVAIGTLMEKAASAQQEAQDGLRTSIENQISVANAAANADSGLATEKSFLTNKISAATAEIDKLSNATQKVTEKTIVSTANDAATLTKKQALTDTIARLNAQLLTLADTHVKAGAATAAHAAQVQTIKDKIDAAKEAIDKLDSSTKTVTTHSIVHGEVTDANAAKIATLQQTVAKYQGQLDQLNNTQNLAGASTDELASKFDDTAKASIALGFSYTDSIQSLKGLFTETKSAPEALAAYQAALDLARFKGEDLSTATTQVEMALQGQGRALATLGIQIKDGLTPMQALQALQEQVAGQANAYANTTAGKVEAAQQRINKIMADAGQAILPIMVQVLQQLADVLEKVAGWWEKLSPGMQSFIVKALAVVAVLGPLLVILGSVSIAIGSIFTVLGSLVTFVTTAVPAMWAAFVAGGPLLWAIVAVVVVLAALAYEVWKNWDWLSAQFKIIGANIKAIWDAVIDWVSDRMLQIADLWNTTWTNVTKFFQNIWSAVVTWFQNTVITPIQNAIQAVVDTFNKMVSIVSTPIKMVTNLAGSVGSAVGGFFNPNANYFTGGTHEFGGFVGGPKGAAVPTILHGGEEIIPANEVGSRGKGNTVTIIIQNPTVRSTADISEMRKQIESVMRPLLVNTKIAHI